MRKSLTAIGSVLAILLTVTLGPALIRRDVVHYQWAGSIGSGLLNEPIGIAYRDGRLFVTDATRNRIVVFNTAGSVVGVWDESTTGLVRPMHLSVGTDGLLYIAEYLTDRITALDSAGHVVRRIGGATGSGAGELDAPGGVAELGGAVFVADFYNHRMLAFNGASTRIIGHPGRLLRRRLHYPTDVATTDSTVYVADAYNNRIQVFEPDGRYVRRWGGPVGLGIPGRFRGWFRVATGIAAGNGLVYVADFSNDRVQIFTTRGQYRGQITDSLHHPTDVAVAGARDLFVVDFGIKRIARYTLRE